MDCAKGMAMTAYEILTSEAASNEVWKEFKTEFAER